MGVVAFADRVDGGAASWDEELARKLVRSVVKRQAGLFAAFRSQIDADDLVSEGMIRAREAHDNYDPSKARYSTHLCGCVHRRLIDLHRRLVSRARREGAAAALVRASTGGAGGDAGGDVYNGDITDWLGDVLHSAAAAVGNRRIGGRGRPPELSPAQQVALLALKQRIHASARGLEYTLRQRPALVRAAHLLRVPNYQILASLEDSVSKFQKRLVVGVGGQGWAGAGGGGRKGTGVVIRGRGWTGAGSVAARSLSRVIVDPRAVWRRIDTGQQSQPDATELQGTEARRLADSHAVPGQGCMGKMSTAELGDLLAPQQAARELGVDTRTLKEWRRKRLYLRYVREGRNVVLYPKIDVERLRQLRRVIVEPQQPAGPRAA